MEKNKQGNIQMDQQEILHMLKTGRAEEVRYLVEQQKRANYPNEFVPFMDRMLLEHKMSRKKVAVRSGLSQDYVYKLLRGDKHTDERDYILAMCFAIGMNLAQTQHALSSYGMPTLSEGDMRSHIIILANQDNADIDELNSLLEKAGFPLLKTSPDMPSAKITDTTPVSAPAEQTQIAKNTPRKKREFTEIDSFTDGHHNGGNAPFDYDYQGWIRLADEEGRVYQVEAVFASEATSFIVFTAEQRQEAERLMTLRTEREAQFYEQNRDRLENPPQDPVEQYRLYEELEELLTDIPVADMLETYDSLEEAAGSEFFPYFLELDKRTDKKVLEVMKKLDDTREYGIRIGASWVGKELPKAYIEAFNKDEPERREYFQIVQYSDGTCRYTVTHESCYMQMEMGQELYEVYFGHKREPEYVINTDRNEFSVSQMRYRVIFNRLSVYLHQQMVKMGGMFSYDPNKLKHERVSVLIEDGVQWHWTGNEQKAAACYQEAIELIRELGVEENITSYLCTCFKLACTLETLENPESSEWWNEIYRMKDAAVKSGDPVASSCVANAVMANYREAFWDKDVPRQVRFVKEAVDLVENHHALEDDWDEQLELWMAHAFLLEDEDLEESLRNYRRAVTIARDHHLDQNQRSALNVATAYNNYAWVLWNKCGSEEAVLYYGRALDLLESYLNTGVADRGAVLRFMEHSGSALRRLYIDTSRLKEAERLVARLAESGVRLEEDLS